MLTVTNYSIAYEGSFKHD